MVWRRIAVARKLSSQKHPDWLWGPPSLLFNEHWRFFPGYDIHLSSPASTKVKNDQNCLLPYTLSWHAQGILYLLLAWNKYSNTVIMNCGTAVSFTL
jgi:hypothetical protein